VVCFVSKWTVTPVNPWEDSEAGKLSFQRFCKPCSPKWKAGFFVALKQVKLKENDDLGRKECRATSGNWRRGGMVTEQDLWVADE
jgi:hypothetical protein